MCVFCLRDGFAFSALTLLVATTRKGIWTVTKLSVGMLFGGVLTGALHVLRVLVVSSTTSVISRCSNIQDGLTFWYRMTKLS